MSDSSSDSAPAMSESEEGEGSLSDDDIPLDSSNEETFFEDTRGRGKVVKKKPRLEISATKASSSSSLRGKKPSSEPRAQRPRSRSVALSTPSPRLRSTTPGGSSTVSRTEPRRTLPGHTPTIRSGRQGSSTSSHNRPEDHSEQDEDSERPIAVVLGDISNMLGTVMKRLDKTESKLESMERLLQKGSSSSGSSSEAASKKKVPQVVRTETRMTYKTLMDSDVEFTGFDTSVNTTYKHSSNQAVTNLLVKEVQASNPTFLSVDIRAAAYTYYKSLCQEEALKRKGTYEQRKTQRRRRERLIRRLEERQSEFKRKSYSDGDRVKWEKVLISELISSDESEVEDEKAVLVVKEIIWRSDKVTNFFSKLDGAHEDRKSEQARRQTKPRIRNGTLSARRAPDQLPSWAVCS